MDHRVWREFCASLCRSRAACGPNDDEKTVHTTTSCDARAWHHRCTHFDRARYVHRRARAFHAACANGARASQQRNRRSARARRVCKNPARGFRRARARGHRVRRRAAPHRCRADDLAAVHRRAHDRGARSRRRRARPRRRHGVRLFGRDSVGARRGGFHDRTHSRACAKCERATCKVHECPRARRRRHPRLGGARHRTMRLRLQHRARSCRLRCSISSHAGEGW